MLSVVVTIFCPGRAKGIDALSKNCSLKLLVTLVSNTFSIFVFKNVQMQGTCDSDISFNLIYLQLSPCVTSR